ncbi:NADH-quinone oxidoreductase subunit L [bacterium]|nr:MAG: NADH-quinone oxidoreductase subunit L [bacterium]
MESTKNLIWLVLAAPLLGALILGTVGRRLPKAAAGLLGTVAVAISFLAGVLIFSGLSGLEETTRMVRVEGPDWISILGLRVPFEWTIDPLSMLMVLIVTGIGALIHLYSTGYMKEEQDFARFFAYLNLFVAAMLVLVLGNNLPLLFIGWEGVGLCSYLLIGFWYKDLANVKAANKAFIVNRVGDWSLMLGLFLIVVVIAANRQTIQGDRYLSYDQMLPALERILGSNPGMATAIALLLFFGAAGKSAQFPLYFWLPDAMAGPTPVSALIHAATMVTSGVVLLNRMNVVFTASPTASAVVCILGAFTAVFAALIAFGQTDIKKVLAYSTVSQLGYMFLGCGAGAYWSGMFHVTTHAFFKALLFLGAGAVIHAMAHDQDMRNYGNLRKYLPITFGTMVIAWLAISGVPPLSGFYSKEAILGAAFSGSSVQRLAGAVGLFTAFLTALYMTRMMWLTFFGKDERWRLLSAHPPHGDDHEVAHMEDEDPHHHGLASDHKPHEVPASMWVPLVVLAALSLGGGWFLEHNHRLKHWLEPVVPNQAVAENPMLLWGSIAAALAGVVLGILYYQKGLPKSEGFEESNWAKRRLWARDQFGYDNTVTTGAVLGGGDVARVLANQIDQGLIDGAIAGTGGIATRAGGALRGLQNGFIRLYALMMLVGGVAFVAWFIIAISRGGAQ